MEIDLNICHNFCIDTLTKVNHIQMKLYFSLRLGFDGTRTEILLNLTQIQDYTMTNM
jgi:hypothetical protein